MSVPSDDATRERIVQFLSGESINPVWAERAPSQDTFDSVVRALQALEPADLVGKLVTAGFKLRPSQFGDDEDQLVHACHSCVYYERHRRFCNLPELMLPVEPRWSCVVWRI